MPSDIFEFEDDLDARDRFVLKINGKRVNVVHVEDLGDATYGYGDYRTRARTEPAALAEQIRKNGHLYPLTSDVAEG